eukprot:TRINITY_DN10462_c0_g1_i1.p1 TRINITY_DN10462_c0_g1~~TRINITY_DN10462_c0_g1_i1.p1  ORF type:complete len:898 (+),score=139.16 TRINITY_DN10462_c0_g1_i1:170-2695(+)
MIAEARERNDNEKATDLRQSLRGRYESLLLSDPAYCTKNSLDTKLWRIVFYSSIEDYKRNRRTRPMENNRLLRFIDESMSFYETLLEKINTKMNKRQNRQLAQHYTRMCSTMQIHLGDLARYRETYAEDDTKDWDVAVGWYLSSLDTFPRNGNAHNQLAVLAYFDNNTLEAVYRYYRALASKEPFLAARDNLIDSFDRIQRTVPIPTQRSSSLSSWNARPSSKPTDADFITRFTNYQLCLHGMLFTSISLEGFYPTLDIVSAMYKCLCEEYVILSGEERDNRSSLLAKLMIMCVFAVQNCGYRPDGYTMTDGDEEQIATLRTMAMRQAFCLWVALTNSNCFQEPGTLIFLYWLASDDEPLSVLLSAVDEATFFSRLADVYNHLTSTLPETPGPSDISPEDKLLHGFTSLSPWSSVDPLVRKNVTTNPGILASIRAKRIKPLIKLSLSRGFLSQNGETVTSTKPAEKGESFEVDISPNAVKQNQNNTKRGGKGGYHSGKGRPGKSGKGHKNGEQPSATLNEFEGPQVSQGKGKSNGQQIGNSCTQQEFFQGKEGKGKKSVKPAYDRGTGGKGNKVNTNNYRTPEPTNGAKGGKDARPLRQDQPTFRQTGTTQQHQPANSTPPLYDDSNTYSGTRHGKGSQYSRNSNVPEPDNRRSYFGTAINSRRSQSDSEEEVVNANPSQLKFDRPSVQPPMRQQQAPPFQFLQQTNSVPPTLQHLTPPLQPQAPPPGFLSQQQQQPVHQNSEIDIGSMLQGFDAGGVSQITLSQVNHMLPVDLMNFSQTQSVHQQGGVGHTQGSEGDPWSYQSHQSVPQYSQNKMPSTYLYNTLNVSSQLHQSQHSGWNS